MDIDHLRTRDLDLLEVLWEGRFVTIDQAARYIWQSLGAAYRRVKELVQSGFVIRERDARLDVTIIRPKPLAFQALLQRGIITAEEHAASWCWDDLHDRKSIGFIQHEYQTNEFRFCLLDACRDSGAKVVSCRSGPSVVQNFEVGDHKYKLRPDRWLKLNVADSEFPQLFFVEVDRGTKPVQRSKGWDVVTQLRQYEALSELDPEQPFRVLILCSSASRATNIIKHMIGTGGRENDSHWWRGYALWDEFLANPFEKIWLREADPREHYAIIEEWPGWPTY